MRAFQGPRAVWNHAKKKLDSGKRAKSDVRTRVIDGDLYLSEDEAHSEINRLTANERAKILKVAKLHARKLSVSGSAEDLAHDAYERAWSKKRSWPRGVPAIEFIAGRFGIIRSIASASYRRQRRQGIHLAHESVSPEDRSYVLETPSITVRMISDEIWGRFEGDIQVQAVLSDIALGYRGETLLERHNISKEELGALRKRVREQLEMWQVEDRA